MLLRHARTTTTTFSIHTIPTKPVTTRVFTINTYRHTRTSRMKMNTTINSLSTISNSMKT